MSYENAVPVIAGQDLSVATCEYHAVAIGGTITGANATALGILQNRPKQNEDATVGYAGRLRYRAGAAVTTGARLKVTTSGWLIAVTSGTFAVGTALSAVSSGAIGEGIFDFSTARTNLAT